MHTKAQLQMESVLILTNLFCTVGQQKFFYGFSWKCMWSLSFRWRIRIFTNFETFVLHKNQFFDIFKTKMSFFTDFESVLTWKNLVLHSGSKNQNALTLSFFHGFGWKCTWRLSFRWRIRVFTNFEKIFLHSGSNKNAPHFVIFHGYWWKAHEGSALDGELEFVLIFKPLLACI